MTTNGSAPQRGKLKIFFGASPGVSPTRGHLSPARRITGWALAVGLPVTATGVDLLGAGYFGLAGDVVLYFLATVGVALVGGLGPALLAAGLSGLLLNFFFTEPRYTLLIASPSDVISVAGMVLVGAAVAVIVNRAARLATQAARAGTEAALLAALGRTLLEDPDPVPRLLHAIRDGFNLAGVVVLQRRNGGWQRVAADPVDAPGQADIDVAIDTDTRLAAWGRRLEPADRALLGAAAGQAVLALRAREAARAAAAAQRVAEADQLRTALLAAVGHDLRTPLTSIKAAVDSLRDPALALSDADSGELLLTIQESTDRLTALVENLLDSSRLATGAVRPQLSPVGYEEVVARALRTVDAQERVRVEVDDTLPAVSADPGLLERAVANVVDNAVRHGRGAPVVIRGSAHAGRVDLRVCDSGPGLARSDREAVFAPFQRLGDRNGAAGVGLGLSVTRGFMAAMGGSVIAEDTPGGGLTIFLSLPAATAVSSA